MEDLNVQIAGLQETLNEFQRRLFGTSSEKTEQDKTSEAGESEKTDETDETVTTTVRSHKRTTRKSKATREDQYGNLPIHKEVIPLAEASLGKR